MLLESHGTIKIGLVSNLRDHYITIIKLDKIGLSYWKSSKNDLRKLCSQLFIDKSNNKLDMLNRISETLLDPRHNIDEYVISRNIEWDRE